MTPMFSSDAELESALRALRPALAPAFAAELDERAAAGFPPAPGSTRGRLAALFERLRTTPPRRILAPAGAFAVAVIVVATALIATSGTDDRRGSDSNPALTTTAKPAQESAGGQTQLEKAVPSSPSASKDSASSTGSPGVQYEDVPTPATGASAPSRSVAPSSTGPYAAGRDQRDIERTASIVLASDPDGLRDAAAGVFSAVHGADGIVLSSSIDGGQNGGTANFELMIPTAKLSDTLAAISSVGDVRSRHEASDDITAPTVNVSERLQDANATVRGLLDQLAAADTDAERVAAEAELRAARNRAASLRSELSSLDRRANLSRVSVRIETTGSSDGSGGPWGVGDGLDGAGRVLAIAAGVIVIGLAALAPFALLALLAWLARRTWLRRARRAALS
jgi:hypothetical protein